MLKHLKLGVLGAAGVLLLSAYAPTTRAASNAPEIKSLALMATSDVQIGGPWVIAKGKKFFEEEGFSDVDVKLFSAAPQAFPAFVAGQVQAMNHAEQPMLALLAGGVSLKVVGVYADMTGLHGMLASSKIKTAKDLEGKNIGVQKGSPLEWYVRSFCKNFGCDLAKVNLVNMPAPEGAAAIVTGTIDAYAGWQPFIRRALAADASKNLHLLHYENKSRMPGSEGHKKIHTAYSMLYVSGPFLEKNPNTVDALLRVLDKSINFMKTNEKEAASIIAAQYKIAESEAESDIKAVSFGLGITKELVEDFQRVGDLLYSEKLIKQPVEFAKTGLDTAPLLRVKPDVVKYGSQ